MFPGDENCFSVVLATLALACSSSRAPANSDPGDAFPRHLAAFESSGRRLGYVANRNSDTVSVLDLDAITADLEREGALAFNDSYSQLLTRIESTAPEPVSAPG